MFKEFEDVPAYAKLQSQTFCRPITKLKVYLGREVSLIEQLPDEEIIFISSSNKISRKHVLIFWNEEKGGWYAKNLSKNHIFINKMIVKSTYEPIKISNISSLQIDDCKFYFFAAREEQI
jgi:hypothetical protein